MLLKPPIGTSTGGVHANLWMPGTGVLIGPGATSFSATASAEVLRRTPAFVAQTPVSILGKPTWRLLAVFRAKGCEFKRTSDGGCSMCGFEAHADQSVTRADMVSQTSRITDHLIEGRFEQVDLLTLGNFFNDNEYSPELRGYILEEMAKITTLGRIVVESRREYVTAEKLYLALSHLRPDQTLVYSLGYESSNERVRNQILRKGVPENYLDDCIDMSKEAGVDFSAFVMIKPPGLSEAEAIDDAVNSAVHVLEKSARKAVRTHIAFEPAFVTSYGYLNDLFTRGEYRAPW